MSIDDEQKGENDNDEELDLPAMDDAGGDDLVSRARDGISKIISIVLISFCHRF